VIKVRIGQVARIVVVECDEYGTRLASHAAIVAQIVAQVVEEEEDAYARQRIARRNREED
jgi:hypothetical protein